MKSNRGFTLIELLVVISIIALLASVVISSLQTARYRAGDSAVKAGMKQLHTQAQNYLDTAGVPNLGVATTCVVANTVFTDSKFAAILANIAANAAPTSVTACGSTATNWAVGVTVLKGGGTWCTDNSQGWFKAGTVNTATGQCN